MVCSLCWLVCQSLCVCVCVTLQTDWLLYNSCKYKYCYTLPPYTILNPLPLSSWWLLAIQGKQPNPTFDISDDSLTPQPTLRLRSQLQGTHLHLCDLSLLMLLEWNISKTDLLQIKHFKCWSNRWWCQFNLCENEIMLVIYVFIYKCFIFRKTRKLGECEATNRISNW